MKRFTGGQASGWSPYRVSVAALLLFVLLASAALAAIYLLPAEARALAAVPGIAMVIFPNLMLMGAACPKCRKPPLQNAISQSWLLPLWQLWPDRICSSCGTDLTLAPVDD